MMSSKGNIRLSVAPLVNPLSAPGELAGNGGRLQRAPGKGLSYQPGTPAPSCRDSPLS